MRSETRLTRFISLFCLASGLAFPATWSGILVDAGCYESAERNHNVSDSPVLQDTSLRVRLCLAKAKTHSFAIVQTDSETLTLNSTGNALAANLLRRGSGKSPQYVTVTGELKKNAIAVDSITPMK